MSKHTPGPWKANFDEAYYVTGPDLGRVAMMMNLKGALGLGGRRSGDESAANCRLIAAAPKMLAALESAKAQLELEGYRSEGTTLTEINAAIAAANGTE